MNKFIKILLFIFLFMATERFCHKQTEGFRVHKVLSDLPFNPNWETSFSAEDIQKVDQILSQPFYFLGSGGQCYAFISQDQKIVLKLFKHHHMRPESYLNHIKLFGPLEKKRLKLIEHRKERLEHIFGSCKIAYDLFKEESGLIFMHLNKTDLFHKKITIVDKLGIEHQIDADTTEFALQQKAELIYPKIKYLMKQGNIDSAKRCVDSLLDLIVTRSKRGISDNDPIIKRNFGYVDERAVEIDLGSFSKDDYLKRPAGYKRVFFFETLKFKKWIKKRHPVLLEHVQNRIDEILLQEEI